jgi:hypothetical protein
MMKMPSFVTIIPPILFAIGMMGVFLLATRLFLRRVNHQPSQAILFYLLAIGIPLCFIVNVILVKYSPNVVFTDICLGVMFLIVFCFGYYIALKMREEKKALRERHEDD